MASGCFRKAEVIPVKCPVSISILSPQSSPINAKNSWTYLSLKLRSSISYSGFHFLLFIGSECLFTYYILNHLYHRTYTPLYPISTALQPFLPKGQRASQWLGSRTNASYLQRTGFSPDFGCSGFIAHPKCAWVGRLTGHCKLSLV